MLVFDRRLLKTTRINIIVTPVYDQDEEAMGYIYADLNTLCQAHALAVRFEGSVEALARVLALNDAQKEAVSYFADMAPFPFQMLAPFLGLCDHTVKLEQSVEDLCEYLHVLGRILAFDKFIAIPAPARINTVFNKVAFALRKEEIAQFKYALREVENPQDTGIAYITDEEIKRLGSFYKLLTEQFGSVQPVAPVTAEAAAVPVAAAMVPDESLDLEIDPESDWSGFQIPVIAQWKEEVTSGVATTATSSEAFSYPEEPAAEEGSQGINDLITQIATGAANVNSLVGGK